MPTDQRNEARTDGRTEVGCQTNMGHCKERHFQSGRSYIYEVSDLFNI